MTVRWLTAFIDRPAASHDAAARFWSALTASALSPSRGQHGQFATLIPPDGDAYLRAQRLAEGPAGTHLDVHVDDIGASARRAVDAGARQVQAYDDVVVLRSPAGLPWCVVEHHGERSRPPPLPAGDTGELHLVDQICIDIPASRFDEECAFWSRITGWEVRQSSLRSEFRYLVRPDACPLRVLLQRLEEQHGVARAHLDVASTDVEQVVAHHVRLGATIRGLFDHWTVLADPSGVRYCVTARDPRTGVIAGAG